MIEQSEQVGPGKEAIARFVVCCLLVVVLGMVVYTRISADTTQDKCADLAEALPEANVYQNNDGSCSISSTPKAKE